MCPTVSTWPGSADDPGSLAAVDVEEVEVVDGVVEVELGDDVEEEVEEEALASSLPEPHAATTPEANAAARKDRLERESMKMTLAKDGLAMGAAAVLVGQTAGMAEAPFLARIRRGSLAEDTESDDGSNTRPGDDTDDAPAADLDDFPAWYREQQLDDSDGADGGEPAVNPMAWLDALPAVATLEALEFGGVTVLAGDNGTGKSTLVEAIAVAAGFNPEGGSRNVNFRTHDTHSPLADDLILEWNRRPRWGWFLRAETFYNLATYIAADPDLQEIFPYLHDMSHGESFLALAEVRFGGKGLYIFDEPESALSIQGQRRLVDIMKRSLAKGSQFIISTHSPLLMAFPGAAVFEADNDQGLRATTFDALASTKAWRGFWEDPADWFRM